MSRSTAASGSSYFGKYVEETLSKLPGEIRRDAEANIMQELHMAQRTAEHSQTQPPPSQDQQAPFQFQQQSQEFHQQLQQFQQALWQPNPSQWPPRPVGPQPSVWVSQDHSYVQRQFPTLPMTSALLPTNEPHPGPSGAGPPPRPPLRCPPPYLDDSLVSLLGPSPPAAGSFNLSSQLNTPDPLAEDDDDPDLPQIQADPFKFVRFVRHNFVKEYFIPKTKTKTFYWCIEFLNYR